MASDRPCFSGHYCHYIFIALIEKTNTYNLLFQIWFKRAINSTNHTTKESNIGVYISVASRLKTKYFAMLCVSKQHLFAWCLHLLLQVYLLCSSKYLQFLKYITKTCTILTENMGLKLTHWHWKQWILRHCWWTLIFCLIDY